MKKISRLSRNRKKQALKLTVFNTLLIIILVFLLFNFGIKFIFSSSLFISGILNKNKPSKTQEYAPSLGSVDIINVPSATNSAQIVVRGSVLNFEKLDFYLNDEKVKQVDVAEKDNFEEKIGNLQLGDNLLYIVAINGKTKEKKETGKYPILYKKNSPLLEIAEPTDNYQTNKQEIRIKGLTDEGVSVKVNRLPIVVSTQGNFQTQIKLKEGENKILIIATDSAGNQKKKELTINYQKED